MTKDELTSKHLDLRGTPCPLNFIQCRLALEELKPKDSLQVVLDQGEPELMVIPGLREAGHEVSIVSKEASWIKLMVICGAK